MAELARSILRSLGGFDHEAALSTIVAHSPTGIFVASTDSRIVFANDAFCAMVGYDRATLLDASVLAIIHPDDIDFALRDRTKVIEGRLQNYAIQRRYIRKDGKLRWLKGTSSLQCDATTGEPKWIVIQVVDITPQVKAEGNLAAAEERLSMALDSAGQGVWEYDYEAGTCFYSPAYKSMLGYGPAELTTPEEGFLDLLHPDDYERVTALGTRCAQGEIGTVECEFRMRHKSGQWVWILSRGKIVKRMRSGACAHIVGTHTDITSIKEYQARNAALHEKLNIVLTAGRIGVWEIDFSTGKYEWDSRMRELYGFGEGEFDGTLAMWERHMHPDDVPAMLAQWDRALAEGPGSTCEYRIFRKDGTLRHIHSCYRIFRDSEGKALSAVGANIDITDHKLMTAKAIEEKERLAITLRSIGDAVICTNAQSQITFMNPVAEDLTGWTSAEAGGLHLLDVFSIFEEATGNAAPNPVARCLIDNAAYKTESGLLLATRSGGAIDISMSAAPVRAASSDFIGAIIVFNDISESRAIGKRMAHSALHDALTGLPNRAAFMAKMNEAIHQARGEGRRHVLCFIDLDRFKIVNDTGGHAAGDALLREVAKIIALGCTRSDVPARLGGDEFAVLFRDCTAEEAETRAGMIISAISDMEFWWEAAAFRIGASIGAAEITAKSPELSEVLRQADKACYTAKQSGRGQVAFHGFQAHGKRPLHAREPDRVPTWANLH